MIIELQYYDLSKMIMRTSASKDPHDLYRHEDLKDPLKVNKYTPKHHSTNYESLKERSNWENYLSSMKIT